MPYTDNYALPRFSREQERRLTEISSAANSIGFSYAPGAVVNDCVDAGLFGKLQDQTRRLAFEEVGNETLTRKRCMGYAHIYGINELLYFLYPKYDPASGLFIERYNLDTTTNEDFSVEADRSYPALGTDVIENKALHELIALGLYLSPLPAGMQSRPLEVEIQFIQYSPRHSQPAISTPTSVHQDNDWAFCIFLIEREGVEGGVNTFTKLDHVNQEIEDVPESGKLQSITLSDPLDVLAVNDQVLGHHVSPVTLSPGETEGRRTILILSYKPLVPNRPELIQVEKEMPDKKGIRGFARTDLGDIAIRNGDRYWL